MTIRTYIRAFLFLITAMGLFACGGSGGGGEAAPDTLQGVFVDSPVSGLRFETTTASGFTDAQGGFSYRSGELVRFFVGDVFIGEATGQAILTPVELVAGAIDESNIQVQNIAMFLQSIDDDGDESNGINISLSANNAAQNIAQGQSVDFGLAAGVFEADGGIQILISNMTATNGTARSMVSRRQARDALGANLLALFAGNYQGTFTGDDTGSWTVTIDTSGVITGQRTSDNFGEATVSGNVGSSGQSSISGTVDTVVFSGQFSRSGEVSGSWLDDDGTSGVFSGQRLSVTPAPGGGNTPPPTVNSGSLTVSGNDASVIGVSYVPNVAPVVIKDTVFNTGGVTVNWSQSLFSANGFESRSMVFSYNENDGSLLNVGYLRITGTDANSAPTSFYSYSLDCEVDVQACLSISLDVPAQQVSFGGTLLAADVESDATADIGLVGTLSW